MTPTLPPDPHLTALLAAAYRLGLAAGRHGSAAAVPQVGGQFPVPQPGGAGGDAATPVDPVALGHGQAYNAALAQLAAQQNVAATLRDDAMRDALARSEQRRQALDIARWAQLAGMRGTPTRTWPVDAAMSVFRT